MHPGGELGDASKSGRMGRIRRVLVFVAVVWTIAGAFLALRSGALAIFDFAFRSGWISAGMALPKASNNASGRCAAILGAIPNPARDHTADKTSRYLAWQLGYRLGFAAGMVNSEVASRDSAANSLQELRAIARALTVPDVALPEAGRAAYALREFGLFLENDPQCVATALEIRHSPRHAALFKFGAAVGHATVFRMLTPQLGPVFEPQIMNYGSAAQVGAELWKPFLERSIPVPPGSDSKRAVQNIVNRIDASIKSAE